TACSTKASMVHVPAQPQVSNKNRLSTSSQTPSSPAAGAIRSIGMPKSTRSPRRVTTEALAFVSPAPAVGSREVPGPAPGDVPGEAPAEVPPATMTPLGLRSRTRAAADDQGATSQYTFMSRTRRANVRAAAVSLGPPAWTISTSSDDAKAGASIPFRFERGGLGAIVTPGHDTPHPPR